jgi:O-antigen/teichoic acid export membrane protein
LTDHLNKKLALSSPTVSHGSKSATVAKNSFWYGLEIAANFVSVFFTSIAIARAFGPKELGYFNYVLWIANIASAVGSLGLPAATRKYLAEHLAAGENGLARTIFFTTLRLQLFLSLGLTAAGLALALMWAEPHYSLISLLIVLTLVPRMLMLIPSLANVAAENLRANTPGALLGVVVYVIAVTLSLRCGWGLLGVAGGMLLSTGIEFAVKLWITLRWIRPFPKGAPLPVELKRRMFRFSSQSIILMLIDLVVWNRSDIFFLKMLDKDIRQITFFSLAFNLSEKVGLIPDVLGGSMGVSVMAEYTRSKLYVRRVLSTSASYMLLVALPMFLGLAALSGPIVGTLYGVRYLPAAPVLGIAALFAIPKALRHPVEELLQAAEEQKFIILWFCVCGVLDMVLDLLLIPKHGAAGAAIANGSAQLLAVIGTWSRASYLLGFSLRINTLCKTFLSGAVMATVVWTISVFLHHWVAMITGAITGLGVYCMMLRITRVLATEDRERLRRAGKSVPAPARIYLDKLINLLTPSEPVSKQCRQLLVP